MISAQIISFKIMTASILKTIPDAKINFCNYFMVTEAVKWYNKLIYCQYSIIFFLIDTFII